MIALYFIRELYLLWVTLLDWLIKSKRSIINLLLQIVCLQEVLNVSDMQYLMYFSMFYHLNFYNIVEVPGRFILALSSRWCLYAPWWFSWDILTLTKSLPENFRFISYWDLVPRFLGLCISYCLCLQHFIKFCYHSFLAGFSFMDIDNSQNSRGGDETIFIPLYHFTGSQRFRYLFGILHERWLSRVFNRTACIYKTATRRDLQPSGITISLIDDVKIVFVSLIDDLILSLC